MTIFAVVIVLSGLSAIALLFLRVEIGELLSTVTFLLGGIVAAIVVSARILSAKWFRR